MIKWVIVFVLGVAVPVYAVKADESGRIAGLGIGVQAYTFRGNTFEEAIQRTASLGLKYIEGYPGQRLSADTGDAVVTPDAPKHIRARIKAILAANGVRMHNFGVVGFSNDPKAARTTFEFAKFLDVKVLTAEFDPNAFSMVGALAKEFGIRVAIHNHPAPSLYSDPGYLQHVLKTADRRIGACPDIGHWMRSGFDPLDSLTRFRGRVYAMHIKDLKVEGDKAARDWPLGEGIANIPRILKELKKQKFDGVISIEYEASQPDPTADVKKCVEYLRSLRL